MTPEPAATARRAWTIMLADVVALMLTFFVLSLSMREFVPQAGRQAQAGTGGAATFVLAGPDGAERGAAATDFGAAGTLGYVAALLRARDGPLAHLPITQDDAGLTLTLPAGAAAQPGHAVDSDALASRLASLGAVAGRFALAPTLVLPAPPGESLAGRLDRVLAFHAAMAGRAGLGDAAILVGAGDGVGAPALPHPAIVARLLPRPAAPADPGAGGAR